MQMQHIELKDMKDNLKTLLFFFFLHFFLQRVIKGQAGFALNSPEILELLLQ